MITATAKRSIQLSSKFRGGKYEDKTIEKGKKIQLTEDEAIKFWGALDISEGDKKKLTKYAKETGIKRKI